MKKNILYFVANFLLVLVIGLIVGLTCADHIFANGSSISAYACLLVVLCLPSVIYIFGNKMTAGGRISSILFLFVEVILAIVFMVKPSIGIKIYWLIQAVIIGLLLIAFLVILALFKEKNDSK